MLGTALAPAFLASPGTRKHRLVLLCNNGFFRDNAERTDLCSEHLPKHNHILLWVQSGFALCLAPGLTAALDADIACAELTALGSQDKVLAMGSTSPASSRCRCRQADSWALKGIRQHYMLVALEVERIKGAAMGLGFCQFCWHRDKGR